MKRVQISDARQLANDLDMQACVILGVERDGTVTIVTYGEDKAKCRAIGDWGQGLVEHHVTAVPFRSVFGHGAEGVPTPLTLEEYESLGANGRAYADKYAGKPEAAHVDA